MSTVPYSSKLEMFRGDTRPIELTVTDPQTGAPIPITGYSIWFTVKRNIDDADPGIFQCSTAAATVVITDGPNGKAEARPTAVMTNTLTLDEQFFFDWQIKSPGGITDTPDTGILTIVRDVTRAA